MEVTIRSAGQGDVASITPWTTDTFSWGDYVPTRLSDWISEPDSEVLVCVDSSDIPVAMAHVILLSPTEGWLEGARVHPEHRRSGLGSALNDAGVGWARERGARVMRLAIEADNTPARTQVKGLGYREVSKWIFAELAVDATHRAPEQFRMRAAPRSDAEAAWLFWAVSDLARESRELIALGWQWRTARPEDITRAVGHGQLLQSAAGWASVEQPAPDWLRTQWLATTPDDMLPLLDGLLDEAAQREVVELEVRLPDLPWTAEAIRRFGGEPNTVVVYAKPIY